MIKEKLCYFLDNYNQFYKSDLLEWSNHSSIFNCSKYMVIYKITNKETGKIYIGQTHKDINKYWGSGQYIKNAIKKYGTKAFTKEVLCHCNSQDELNEKEIFYINEFNCIWPNGYNLTNGGGGIIGYKFSEESKLKMSKIQKGKKTGEKNPMYGKGCLRAGEKHHFYGKKHTEETKKKMSKLKIGKVSGKNNPMYGRTGEKHPFYGKTHSQETKKKMLNNRIIVKGEKHWLFGKKLSEETRRKQSESHKGNNNPMYRKIVSEETKIKMSNSRLKEKNHMFGKIWINNGISNKTIFLKDKIPEGWKSGMVKKLEVIDCVEFFDI